MFLLIKNILYSKFFNYLFLMIVEIVYSIVFCKIFKILIQTIKRFFNFCHI